MLETFDYPEMGPNCVARTVSIVSPQSLMMMNNAHVRELAAAFANRVQAILSSQESESIDPAAEQVDTVYQLALNRLPSDIERRIGIEALNQLQTEWQGDRHAALETYCHTILNSAAFLYVD